MPDISGKGFAVLGIGSKDDQNSSSDQGEEFKMDVSDLMSMLQKKRETRSKMQDNSNVFPIARNEDKEVHNPRLETSWNRCYVLTRRDVFVAGLIVLAIIIINNAIYMFDKSHWPILAGEPGAAITTPEANAAAPVPGYERMLSINEPAGVKPVTAPEKTAEKVPSRDALLTILNGE